MPAGPARTTQPEDATDLGKTLDTSATEVGSPIAAFAR